MTRPRSKNLRQCPKQPWGETILAVGTRFLFVMLFSGRSPKQIPWDFFKVYDSFYDDICGVSGFCLWQSRKDLTSIVQETQPWNSGLHFFPSKSGLHFLQNCRSTIQVVLSGKGFASEKLDDFMPHIKSIINTYIYIHIYIYLHLEARKR